MKVLRTLFALAGVAALAGGVVAVVAPETIASVPVDEAVALLGNDYLLVAILGCLGVGATLVMLAGRTLRGIDQATPPDPEGVPTGRRPGTRFDARVDAWRGAALWLRPNRRERVRERLFEAAVETIVRTTGSSRAEARRQVERGAWTDDPEVSAFLAEDGRARPLQAIAATLRGEAPTRRRARRTVAAIERLERGESA